jgi:hypothetical protein
MGRIITPALVDSVETEVEDERAGRGNRRTVGEVIDADLHATARTGLSFGVSTESEEGEQSEPRGVLGEKGNLHDECFAGV